MLEQLDSDDNALVEMLMKGYTLDEIAARSGITYAAAAVRIHRLREKLLKYMKIR